MKVTGHQVGDFLHVAPVDQAVSWDDAGLHSLLWPLCSQAMARAGCSWPPGLVLSLCTKHTNDLVSWWEDKPVSTTFQRKIIYTCWETVQTTLLLFCKLLMEEFMELSNKYSLWAAPEREPGWPGWPLWGKYNQKWLDVTWREYLRLGDRITLRPLYHFLCPEPAGSWWSCWASF